jgi:hypothetical protein
MHCAVVEGLNFHDAFSSAYDRLVSPQRYSCIPERYATLTQRMTSLPYAHSMLYTAVWPCKCDHGEWGQA